MILHCKNAEMAIYYAKIWVGGSVNQEIKKNRLRNQCRGLKLNRFDHGCNDIKKILTENI